MERRHKDLLISKNVYLTDNLDMPELFNHMIGTRLLSGNDVEILKHCASTQLMAQKFLLEMLPKRGPQAFGKFIAALVASGEQQSFIAYKLDPELARSYENADDDGSGDYTDAPAGNANVASNSKTDEDIIKTVRDSLSACQSVQSTTSAFVNGLRKEDYYPMCQRVRGRAVIINNKYFVNLPARYGSENDLADLKKLFDSLHFEVVPYENKSAQEIRDIAAAESRRDHSQCDAFVLFVMSHGCDGHVLGNDEKRVDILKEIADVVGKCSTLRNKPKMLFFQACRNDPDHHKAASGRDSSGWSKMADRSKATDQVDSEKDEVDGAKRPTLDEYADFFIAYATIPGNVAVRNTELGSWFVRFFVYVCSTESHYNDLQSMMNKVNRLVQKHLGREQVTESIVRLSHGIFFFPKYFKP